jgi:tRNA C32,U32 (ribose-2'-O)-methylase TrmJ
MAPVPGRLQPVSRAFRQAIRKGISRLRDDLHRSGARINAAKKGKAVDPAVVYPTVDDGVKGVAFVEACVASSKRNGAWVKV